MWCKHCRQDTPCIAATSRHGMCCGRCGVALSAHDDNEASSPDEPVGAHPAEVGLALDQGPPPGLERSFEDWQLEQNVRRLQARIDPMHRRQPRPKMSSSARRPRWRVDAAHTPPAPHKSRRRAPADRPGRSPTFTNSALLLGLVAGVGGVGVLGYSVIEARGELWNGGLSAVVAGGVVFLLGLVLQLERIWHNSRVAVQKLRQIDSHLQDLERTTAALGVTQGPASQSFYAHLADAASPHLLLSDLKGQIDLLAMQLARR